MPIKTAPSVQIDYLSNYVPYNLADNILVEDIDDILTYSVQEFDPPVTVNYTFGSSQLLVKTILIKNTTSNANVEVRFEYDSTYINYTVTDAFSGEIGLTANNDALLMTPTQVFAIQILISDKTIPVGGPFDTSFKIFAKSIPNNGLIIRRPEVVPLQPRADLNTTVTLSI